MARSKKKTDRVRPLERALHRLGEAERRLRRAAAARHELGTTDLDTLLLLDEAGPLSAGRIAEALEVTSGAVTGLVDRLRSAGWVERTRLETDRRQVLVDLAPARRDAITELRGLRERLLDEAVADVDDDTLATLARVVDAAAEHLFGGAEAMTAEGGAGPEDAGRAPLDGVSEGRLRFTSGVPQLELRGGRIRDLYRASYDGRAPEVRVEDGTITFRYRGISWFGAHGVGMQLTLTRAIPWTIEIRRGVSKLTADLTGLDVRAIEISGGASSSEITLPGPRGEAVLRVTGGANHVVVRRPRGVAVRALVRGGASSLAFDAQRLGAVGGTIRLESPGWEDAADRWSIELSGGASDLRVVEA